MPAPVAVVSLGADTLANVNVLSSIVTLAVLIVVVVPSTVRSPVTTRLPPTFTVLVGNPEYIPTVRVLESIDTAVS